MSYLTKTPEGLLACPHCGGEAEARDGSSTTPYIRCKSCGCRTGSSWDVDKLKEKWNRRAGSACEQRRTRRTCRDVGKLDEFVCSECGASLYMLGWYDDPTYWVDDVAAALEYCPNCGAKVVGE